MRKFMMTLKIFLEIYLKNTVNIFHKIFRRKKFKQQESLKEFTTDCNKFYEKYIHENFLLNGDNYIINYDTIYDHNGIQISNHYNTMADYFTAKNKVNSIYITVIVNKLLEDESD